jgi:hypothetical protein
MAFVTVGCMEKGCRQVVGRETRSIEKWLDSDGQGLVPLLRTGILQGAICACRLDDVFCLLENCGLQCILLASSPPRSVRIMLPDALSWMERKSMIKSTKGILDCQRNTQT